MGYGGWVDQWLVPVVRVRAVSYLWFTTVLRKYHCFKEFLSFREISRKVGNSQKFREFSEKWEILRNLENSQYFRDFSVLERILSFCLQRGPVRHSEVQWWHSEVQWWCLVVVSSCGVIFGVSPCSFDTFRQIPTKTRSVLTVLSRSGKPGKVVFCSGVNNGSINGYRSGIF